jgi:hypothetical protein
MPADSEGEGDGEDHEGDVLTSDDDVEVPYMDLDEYIQHLDRQGTLDTQHMMKYVSWKREPLTDEVLEICKFLRSVECGGGSSDGGALHSLRYAKSLGGRGDLLPKTIDTCWKKISKVLLHVHCNVYHTVQYNVHYHVRFNIHYNIPYNVHYIYHNIHYNIPYNVHFIYHNVHFICTITLCTFHTS